MHGSNVGIDIGYGFLKCRSGSRHFVLPSVVGTAQNLAYRSELSGYTAPEDNVVVETDGNRYFVGSLAVRQSEVAARSLAEDRPGDPAAKVLFRTALALLQDPSTSTFNVVTGLPPISFRAYQDRLRDMVAGDHHVVLGGEHPVERDFRVASVRVIPQPFGTLFDLLLDDTGSPQNLDLGEARLGICDVGFRTADCVVADRLDYIDRQSFSTTCGMSAAYALISTRLQREFGVTKSNYELDPIVRAGRLRLGGTVHDITEIRNEAYQAVAEKILTEIRSAWPVRDLDVVYLSGGGAEALSRYFLEALDTAVLAGGPQEANVRGYWKLANKLFGGPEADSPNGRSYVRPEQLAQSLPV
ncbi:MAG TPA: ParM/StbA family protein [Bacillota bacterium]|nr:ParM/StbA family protein [Bacillota bacterium]